MQGVLIRNWLPVLLWAVVIFWGSTDALSTQRTSRFLGPFLRWLAPGLSDEAVDRVRYAVRKTGHLFEYAVLAMLLNRALRGQSTDQPVAWSWRRAGWALGLAAAYALTDEWHQSMVTTRFGSGWDVLIDVAGAAMGLAISWCFARRRSRR
jgi:VanZ family protein